MNRSPALAARRVRQTLAFANGPSVLAALATAGTPWRREELVFRTRDGAVIACPNHAGARVPVYEVLVEDAYWLGGLELPASAVVLDIGAQVGCFAVAVARRFPDATVHSYEASPSTATWLRRNVTANGLDGRVTPYAVAVGSEDGTLQLADNVHASALNGLTATSGELVTVPCESFPTVLAKAGGRADLVKMDVEGAEYATVLSAPAAAWEAVDRVVLEYHDVPGRSWPELRSYFGSCGLREVRHDPATPRQGTVWLTR